MREIKIPLFQFIEQVRKPPKIDSAEQRIRHFAKIYSQFSETEAREQSSRCIDCGNPYCGWKCPVHNRIPQWLKLVAENRIMEAADLAHQTNALPEMCGQICPQASLCEGACTLNGEIGAVTIGAIEFYLTDTALRQGWKPDLSEVKPLPWRVAIVGAGPAGIACADRLARLGISADVFDQHPEIGGLLTFGIPQFKLEKKLVLRRRAILEGMGIHFHLNTIIGIDLSFETLIEKYDAVFLAMGADAGISSRLKGEQMKGVYPALPFLIAQIKPLLGLEADNIDLKNKKVMILGAGDTAMDCSRTSIRLGASEVHCLYRRRECDLCISEKDYHLAKEEGVEFHWQQQVTAFRGKKQLDAVEVSQTTLNAQGEWQVSHNKKIMAVDAVIIAYGFTGAHNPNFAKLGIQSDDAHLIRPNQQGFALQTHHPKIFAGGDMVLGANLVVTAVAQGQDAAQSIYHYLRKTT